MRTGALLAAIAALPALRSIVAPADQTNALPPPRLALERDAPGRRQSARGWLWTLVLTVVVFGGTRAAVQSVQVEGASMEPTLLSGQHLLIDKTAYLFDTPQRGHIALLRPPSWPNENWIKRIVALPADTVLVVDDVVLVNGAVVDEPYVRWPAEYMYPTDGQPLAVPAGFYVLLGDNRPQSTDSHRVVVRARANWESGGTRLANVLTRFSGPSWSRQGEAPVAWQF